MNIKTIKYNKIGFTRAANTTPKFIKPKNDLNKKNIKIATDKHYICVIKKNS
jgi:hypothetical protein